MSLDEEPQRVEWDVESKSWAWLCDFCEPFHTPGYDTLDDAEDAMVDHQLDVHHAGEPRTA